MEGRPLPLPFCSFPIFESPGLRRHAWAGRTAGRVFHPFSQHANWPRKLLSSAGAVLEENMALAARLVPLLDLAG